MPSPIPHPLDAVIFDMDGLLLDSERLFREAMRAACADRAIDLPEVLFLAMVGQPWPANRQRILDHYGPAFAVDAYRTECFAQYERLSATGTPLRPGVHGLLDRLVAAGIPRAVATSTATERARHKLAQVRLLDRFDALVGADDVARHKPDPEPYLTAAARLGARPAHCLALEDSHTGIRAAAAAGMATIMVPDLLPPTEETARLCVATVAGLDDVAALLAAAGVGPPHAPV